MKKLLGFTLATVSLSVLLFFPTLTKADVQAKSMYRMYNPNSGEHFYTSALAERKNLVNLGWKYEGIAWYAPASGQPVYRLYNPNAGDHHYTLDGNERQFLIRAGWRDENIGWYSDTNRGVSIYRAFNPNARVGTHNFTASLGEQNVLVKLGWQDEKIAWYGLANIPQFQSPLKTPLYVTSPFGNREDPTGRSGTQHDGVDLYGTRNQEILAAREGVVVDTGNHYSAGNYVVLQHDNGLYSYYFHLTKSLVVKNQEVTTGQVIGLMGDTGYATGVHLHFGLSKQFWREYIDPQPYLESYIQDWFWS